MNENYPVVVRHLDETGRIVIPGDIRKALRIREGDPLEISISRESIILKKYNLIYNLGDVCTQMLSAFARKSNASCVICGTEHVITGRGISISSEAFLSDETKYMILSKEPWFYQDGRTVDLLGSGRFPVASIAPVINGGKAFGAVILLRYRNIEEWEFHRTEMLADMLSQIIQDAQ